MSTETRKVLIESHKSGDKIKKECEELRDLIKISEDKLEELIKICNHEKISEIPGGIRGDGAYLVKEKCEYCGHLIRGYVKR